MTLEILDQLQSNHAFDPTPLREDLAAYHVTFDKLLGNRATEAELDRAVRSPERVAVVGPSGGGKSSVMFAVLHPLVEGIAPIRLPVQVEGMDVVGDPHRFAAYLVRTMARYAAEAGTLTQQQRAGIIRQAGKREQVGGTSRTMGLRIGAGWMAANAELAAELVSVTAPDTISRSAAEVIEQAARVLDTIRSDDLLPVLLIEDSDAWLDIEGLPDPTPLIGAFFGKMVRMMTEELRAGVVVAVHERYLDMEAYRSSAGFIETTIELPPIPDALGLAAILGRRVQLHSDGTIEDVCDVSALEELFGHYRGAGATNIRHAMLVAHTALRAAASDGAATISARHIEAAIAASQPGYALESRSVPPRHH